MYSNLAKTDYLDEKMMNTSKKTVVLQDIMTRSSQKSPDPLLGPAYYHDDITSVNETISEETPTPAPNIGSMKSLMTSTILRQKSGQTMRTGHSAASIITIGSSVKRVVEIFDNN